MPPFFPNDFVSPSKAIALVGAALYGDEWNRCPTLGESVSLHNAVAAFRKERTIARQRELWPALSASSRIMRRRARVLELGDEKAAQQFVSLGDADIKAIDDAIEAKFAEELARERRCWQAKNRLLELFCSAQVTTTLLVSSGMTFEMPCEFWASDQAMSAVDSGKASYNPAIYKSGPFETLQGRVLVPKAELIAVLEGAPDSGPTQSDAIDVDMPGSDQTDVDGLSPREKRKRKTAETYKRWYLRSKELKSEGRLTRRSEIARRIAKKEPGTTSENIRRRLSEEYPTWPD